jgi:hypothetical protein
MLPLIIVWSSKIRSLANRYGSIGHRAKHVIAIKRHSIVGGIIALFLVFLCFVGDILFICGIVIFTSGGILLVFLVLCLDFVNSALSFSSFFMSSSIVAVVEVSTIEAFSSAIRFPSSPSGGSGVLPYPLVFDIFSPSD